MNSVNYQFEITDIAAHIVSVSVSFKPTAIQHELALPAWIPGSYMIRDFARNITSISAADSTGPVMLKQVDKQRWLIECSGDIITVNYQIYAYDLSVRAAYIDDEVAVLNPACLCLSVSEQQNFPHNVNIVKPTQPVSANWRVATGLTRHNTTDFLGFGQYTAQHYQQLIDCPVLMGQFELRQFSIKNVPHYLVVTGENITDLDRFNADLTKICAQQVEVFTSLPDDLSEYWFLLWVTEDGYGGLEHCNSTLLLCSRYDLPSAQCSSVDEKYQNLLALCSHEYFHTWWVKRIKPENFMQYQLDSEQYTSQLWLYEGFTSYFDDIALARTGLIDSTTYIKTLEKLISRVTRNPSDKAQSLTDSSFTAWSKFYKQDENAVNAVASYYAKGALLALCLEAKLRSKSSNLSYIVRQLWQRFVKTGTPDNALQIVLNELGFTELADSVDDWINAKAPLPLADLLPALGLEVIFRPMQHGDDFGGDTEQPNHAFIGALTKPVQNLLQLSHIYHGGSAHNAGLMVGDQLLAIDGKKISTGNLAKLLQRYSVGSEVVLHFYRKDRLLQCSLSLTNAVQQVAILAIKDTALCDEWLSKV